MTFVSIKVVLFSVLREKKSYQVSFSDIILVEENMAMNSFLFFLGDFKIWGKILQWCLYLDSESDFDQTAAVVSRNRKQLH